jgi:levansucrase
MTSNAAKAAIETLRWTAESLADLEPATIAFAPVLGRADVLRVAADFDVWDAWPLADVSGRPVPWRGGELWFALTAPANEDPEARHGHARIHHFHRCDGSFRHLGATMPEGFTPGSREWSGTARLEGAEAVLYFTAAGERGEASPTYRQRMYETRSLLGGEGEAAFLGWSEPRELLAPGGAYLAADECEGRIGEVKAFRDPSPWCGADGAEYLLFTGSSAAAPRAFNGLVGLALRDEAANGFVPLAPLVDATDTNNELERPHIVERAGQLYLFWSTQAKVFAPGITAPTGLYGATASAMGGPWRLLNGHGLVFANPANEPFQNYSWWVLPDLSVASFVDYWGINDPSASEKPYGRKHFGGTFAPFLKLGLDGSKAWLA